MKLIGGGLFIFLVGACTTDHNVDLTGTSLEPIQANEDLVVPNGVPFPNPTGLATTISLSGGIDFSNDYFQDLGTNGRRCVSCHLPTAGWTTTPSQIQLIFDLSNGGEILDGLGLSAIFRTNDGSVSPNADVSTLAARRKAYALLLSKGLIRIGLPMPANAEFTLVSVNDPYGFASASQLSMFRRPLPAVNVSFLSTVMWDGRENAAGQIIHFDLGNQASDATTGHAQGNPLTADEEANIVNFEEANFFAQQVDFRAGNLDADGAQGGPQTLTTLPFHIGINDNFGDCIDPVCMVIGAPLGSGMRGAPFTPDIFTIYNAWSTPNKRYSPQRESIARGQALFDSFPITITGVGGLNDNAAFGSPASLVGTCGTCHDTPNVGDHSVAAPLNIGLADDPRFMTPDLPTYTFRNNTTGALHTVTDPGRGLITGKWVNLGEFKGPILHGLAARAPYFHNGFAADLDAVIDFYNERFNMNLTTQQHNDFVAFLQTL